MADFLGETSGRGLSANRSTLLVSEHVFSGDSFSDPIMGFYLLFRFFPAGANLALL